MELRLNPPVIEGEEVLDFGHALAAHAAQGDAPALICGGSVWSWADFAAETALVAGRLAAEGVGPGTTIASLAENSAEHAILYAAVLHAGACMVPLPYSATDAALAGMMKDSDAALLFVSAAQAGRAPALGAQTVLPLDDLLRWSADATPIPPVDVPPEALFNIIYSSGTTGVPKGIQHDRRFRARQMARQARLGVDGSARMIASTPLYSNTTLFAALSALYHGATLILMPKFDITEFLRLSEMHRVTHAMLVPVQYMRLMAAENFGDYDLSSYKIKYTTSAPLPPQVAAAVMDRWPGNLVEFYGMTEGGVSCMMSYADAPRDKWSAVGKPTEGAEIGVIDEAGTLLPEGSYGEVVGRAGSMMTAYRHLPDKTAEIIWRDDQGRDWIRSGDMGRVDEDGYLHLLDRKKDMIISGGFNIYAADLEAQLRQDPAVADVAVIAIPSEQWGETPLGLVVPAAGSGATEAEVLARANAALGKTQRLSRVEFRESLPRSEIGKVLKKDLRAPYWEKAEA